MDKIHKPDELPYVTQLIKVADWARRARAAVFPVLTYDAPETSDSEQIALKIGCDPAVVEELAEVCSVENLLCGEEDILPVSDKVPATSNLYCIRVQKEELKKRKNALSYRQMVSAKLKYRRWNFELLQQYWAQSRAEGVSNYEPKDVVLLVALMKPNNQPHDSANIKLNLDVIFMVAGSQYLSELRDRISCLCDFAISEDYSNDPDAPQEIMAKHKYKGGFFFINNTFYNDHREPTANDLSDPIFQWASTGRRVNEIGELKKDSMADTRFSDLEIRLGFPYLYQHQGTCQHLMFFTELRRMDAEDCQNLSEYPVQVTVNLKGRTICCACKLYTAKWVTYNNIRLPFDPGFFCDRCFRAFNYDADGKKIGSFTAIPFVDRHALS